MRRHRYLPLSNLVFSYYSNIEKLRSQIYIQKLRDFLKGLMKILAHFLNLPLLYHKIQQNFRESQNKSTHLTLMINLLANFDI